MTREEAMQSFVTSYTVTGSRIGHKSARTPTDHAVLPEHAEAACGAKVLVIRAGADAPPFDSERPFTCTNCKRTLKNLPPPLDAVEASHAANDRRWKNAHHANAVGATRAPVRARIVAAPRYGRPALALKVEGGDLSVQLIAAGFQDGDVVEIVQAGERVQAEEHGQRNHTELRRQRDQLADTNTRLSLRVGSLLPLAERLAGEPCRTPRLAGEPCRTPRPRGLCPVEWPDRRRFNWCLPCDARRIVNEAASAAIPQPPASTAACYLAAHDDGRPDPHGEADPARAE